MGRSVGRPCTPGFGSWLCNYFSHPHCTEPYCSGKPVSPAGQGPCLGAASEELSPRATSVPGLRAEQGAWGLAVPSRDPGTVDRCGPEGTEAPGGSHLWRSLPVSTIAIGQLLL